MVVLNACYSKDQAKQLQEIVDFTIGMNKPIGDEAAIAFASHFYQGLAFGRSVQTAFALGKGQLEILNIPESKTPELLVRHGVDPTKGLHEKESALPRDKKGRPRREHGDSDHYKVRTKVGGGSTVTGDVYGMRIESKKD